MSDLRCRIGMHAYHPTTNDEGSKYLVCERCGKESFPSTSSGPRIVP
jgi:ribosomal protein L37E